MFIASNIAYDPSYFSNFVDACIYMKGMHGSILIRMRDYIMTYGSCLNTSFPSLKHIIYGYATKRI